MSQSVEDFEAPPHDGLYQRIQKHLSGIQVKIPLEIRLWGGYTYRFGEEEPTVKVLVKDRKGLEALRRLDELRICEAYMNGSLDVMGDMMGFVSLRRMLSDSHPLSYLWQRIAPWVHRADTDRPESHRGPLRLCQRVLSPVPGPDPLLFPSRVRT